MAPRESARAFLLPALAVVGCVGASGTQTARPAAQPKAPATATRGADNEIVALLREAVVDERQWEKRNQAMGTILPFAPRKFWQALYPVKWARERLVRRGSTIVQPLIRIATDSDQEPDTRLGALNVLARTEKVSGTF